MGAYSATLDTVGRGGPPSTRQGAAADQISIDISTRARLNEHAGDKTSQGSLPCG